MEEMIARRTTGTGPSHRPTSVAKTKTPLIKAYCLQGRLNSLRMEAGATLISRRWISPPRTMSSVGEFGAPPTPTAMMPAFPEALLSVIISPYIAQFLFFPKSG
jgi:hypothetical protein